MNQTDLQVEIGRAPTAEQLASWYEEHSIKPDENGVFTELPYGPPPVEKAAIVDQVRVNAQRRNVPNLRAEKYIPRTMVFCAGGPTLADHLDEIREKAASEDYDIFTSNATCRFLLSKGIRPKYHVIIDPTEKKKKDLEYDGDDVTLILGLQCHPAVFEAIGNRKAFKFLAASATDRKPSDVEVAQEACHPGDPDLLGIGGGSMMGTRVMYLAHVMGYRKLEYYGFDACVKFENGYVRNYAYNKQRAENILEVTAANGRQFYSTLAFSRQANEILNLLENLPGLEVTIHGDSFMSNQVAMWKEQNQHADYFITPEYRDLQKQMFATSERYAKSGHAHASRVFMAGAQLLRKYGKCDILDYGCGRESLRTGMEGAFPTIPGMKLIGYDPNVDEFSADPAPAELVYCGDVMEHVEPQCVDAVLRRIAGLSKHLAMFVISTRKAFKNLPDGRNAHICHHDKDWWMSFLGKYFVVVESAHNPVELFAVCEPIHAHKARTAKK